MEPITVIAGAVSDLDRSDVDTDQIIPKQFLKRIERTGFGEFLFYDWAKQPGWHLARNPILTSGRNFGCGSSREHAPWAIEDYGFRAVVAPSFGDIFYNNSFKNGILPIRLPREVCDQLIDDAKLGGNARVTIDLARQVVIRPNGEEIHFDIDPFRKHLLLNGLDDIGQTLQHAKAIDTHEARQHQNQPWLPTIAA